jgi:hypothetical protein
MQNDRHFDPAAAAEPIGAPGNEYIDRQAIEDYVSSTPTMARDDVDHDWRSNDSLSEFESRGIQMLGEVDIRNKLLREKLEAFNYDPDYPTINLSEMPMEDALRRLDFPIEMISLAQAFHCEEIARLPKSMRVTAEVISQLLDEHTQLVENDLKQVPFGDNHSTLKAIEAIETGKRRLSAYPEKYDDMGYKDTPRYDNRDEDMDRTEDLDWVFPIAIVAWPQHNVTLAKIDDLRKAYQQPLWNVQNMDGAWCQCTDRRVHILYEAYNMSKYTTLDCTCGKPQRSHKPKFKHPFTDVKSDCKFWMTRERPVLMKKTLFFNEARQRAQLRAELREVDELVRDAAHGSYKAVGKLKRKLNYYKITHRKTVFHMRKVRYVFKGKNADRLRAEYRERQAQAPFTPIRIVKHTVIDALKAAIERKAEKRIEQRRGIAVLPDQAINPWLRPILHELAVKAIKAQGLLGKAHGWGIKVSFDANTDGSGYLRDHLAVRATNIESYRKAKQASIEARRSGKKTPPSQISLHMGIDKASGRSIVLKMDANKFEMPETRPTLKRVWQKRRCDECLARFGLDATGRPMDLWACTKCEGIRSRRLRSLHALAGVVIGRGQALAWLHTRSTEDITRLPAIKAGKTFDRKLKDEATGCGRCEGDCTAPMRVWDADKQRFVRVQAS